MLNDYYRVVINKASFGCAFHQITYNDNGEAVGFQITELNSAFERFTGVKGSDVIGKPATEALPKIINDSSRWIRYLISVAQRESRVEFTHYFEKTQYWCKINVLPLTMGCFVVLINNITDEKKIEKQLREKAGELEKFFLLVPDLLCIADTDGYLLKINNAWRRLGYSKEKLLTSKYTEFVHPADHKKTAVMFKKLARRKKVIDVVNRYRCADGSLRYLSWRATPQGNKVYAVARDITNIKKDKDRLAASKELLRVTLHSIGDGVITTDGKGRILMLNATAAELTGWQASAAVGKPFNQVFNLRHGSTRQDCLPMLESVLQGRKSKESFKDTLLISKSQQERFVEGSAACIKNHQGDILGLVFVFRDVTEEKQRAQEITYLSYYDKLTGVYNRAFFEEQLRRLDQPRQLPLSLIMGDVNGLKLTNDVFGHQQGDQLLIDIAQILQQNCRAEDIVARWGGDEFVILLPQTTNQTAEKICDRIRQACAAASNNAIKLSIALGYATKKEPEENVMQVLKRAEDNMYKNKLLSGKSLRSSIVASLKKAMYEKNNESEAHGERLSKYCKKMGRVLGLPESDINDLELLSLLHDIGTVMIKDSILNSSKPLTPEEWQEIKKHPEVGYRIAQSVPELAAIAEYILSHHERWDGQGYPQGLKGKDIPLLSRIFAVADAYEAMTQQRPHRPPLTREQAVAELLANAGTQFDPDIVNIFIHKVLPELAT